VVVLTLHLFNNLELQTTTTLTSHIPMLPTDAPMPIRPPLHSHRLTTGCAQRTIADGSPASPSLTSNGRHAVRSVTHKALPRTRRLATRRRAHALHGDVSAVSTLTPSLAGILLVNVSAASAASTPLARDTPRLATQRFGHRMISNRQLRMRTLLPDRPQLLRLRSCSLRFRPCLGY